MPTFEELMIEYWSYANFDKFEKFFTEHVSDDFEVEYGPNMTVDKRIYLESLRTIYLSFPDFHYEQNGNTLTSDGTFIADVFVKCTHTGMPYSIHPGLPAIEPSGVVCENHPERYVCIPSTSNPLKLGRMKVSIDISRLDKPRKKIIGPPGLYMQIGGTHELEATTPELLAPTQS